MNRQSLWQNRNYRLVFSASAISNLGDGVAALALPWLASLMTREPVLIAMVATAGRLPWLLLSLPAGVWTDRADRRRLIIRADVVRFFLTLSVVWMALTAPMDRSMVWGLAAIAFLLGCAEVIRDNAAQTLLPSLVAKVDLERANGQMWSVEEVMGRFIGPPLAGALIGYSMALPFGLDAVSFALSAALFMRITLPKPVLVTPQAFWPALREGIIWMRGNPVMLQLAMMVGVLSSLYAATLAVLVLYGQEILGLSAAGYGLLLTAGAVGGVVGGLVGPRVAARIGGKTSLVAALVLIAAAYLILSVTRSVTLAAIAMFIEAFAGVLWNVVTVSYRQRIIPAPILGRVNSIYRFFATGAMSLGALTGGVIVAALEPALGRDMALHAPFIAACAGYCALLVYAVTRLEFE
ncbi:MAG: MFS transporter [Paracoccaceae bacterium]